tara:strand:- start:149 stop:1174 length:1026 start_codon:yes stop_codon:yes gene_type:complete
MDFTIKLADKEDLDLLISFIDKQWEKNHIFVKSKKLFNWQYFNKVQNKYNFVLGISSKTKKINGILGFIPLNHYDNKIKNLCWMSLWKVQEDARGCGLGKLLLLELQNKYQGQLYTVGANKKTIPIYKSLGLKVGKLNHFFIINPKIDKYKLINVDKTHSKDIKTDKFKKIKKISKSTLTNSFDSFKPRQQFPFKSANYIINRYLNHPFYHYNAYTVSKKQETLGLVIIRKCFYKKSTALRIVDYIGPSNVLKGLYSEWCKILYFNNSEYIDFYNYGLVCEDLIKSGFSRNENKEIIIPNHFEPFEKKNVDINFMVPSFVKKKIRIFKGDSDQDRPNILKD